MYFMVIACLIGAASAANFCCTPDQWEGSIGLVMGQRENGVGKLITGSMHIAYDGMHKIIMTNQTLDVNGMAVQQRIVSDYKNNVMYTITPTSCSKQGLGPWMPNCIPDNATETNSRYGLGAETLQVKTYYIDYVNFQVFMAVTSDTCVPVAEDVLGRFGQRGRNVPSGSCNACHGQRSTLHEESFSVDSCRASEVVQNMVYTNITPGISDSQAFQVPAQCNDAPVFNAANTALGRRSTLF